MISILFHPRNVLTYAVLGLGLAACGTAGDQPLGQFASAAISQVMDETAGVDDVRAQLTPAAVAAVQEPFVLVSLPTRQASATLRVFANVDGRIDWRGNDGISIVTRDDIVIATRGLGADLFLAEAAGLRSVLAKWAGMISRRHSLLDGENRETIVQYDCTISFDGMETVDLIARNTVSKKMTETCHQRGSDGVSFTNQYWIGASDELMWQSKQWINDDIGYLMVQHIKH